MRTLADSQTGELMELLDSDYVQSGQPYSYPEAKAAHMRSSVERRAAVEEYEKAIHRAAEAEKHYRRELAKEVVRQKTLVGATLAETAAKGTEHVAKAREDALIADGLRYAALERIRTCDEDHTGIAQLVKWSQAVAEWER